MDGEQERVQVIASPMGLAILSEAISSMACDYLKTMGLEIDRSLIDIHIYGLQGVEGDRTCQLFGTSILHDDLQNKIGGFTDTFESNRDTWTLLRFLTDDFKGSLTTEERIASLAQNGELLILLKELTMVFLEASAHFFSVALTSNAGRRRRFCETMASQSYVNGVVMKGLVHALNRIDKLEPIDFLGSLKETLDWRLVV